MEQNPKKQNPAAESRASNPVWRLDKKKDITSLHPLQHRLLWKAHQQCVSAYDADPSPVNELIARTIATQWREAFQREVCHE